MVTSLERYTLVDSNRIIVATLLLGGLILGHGRVGLVASRVVHGGLVLVLGGRHDVELVRLDLGVVVLVVILDRAGRSARVCPRPRAPRRRARRVGSGGGLG